MNLIKKNSCFFVDVCTVKFYDSFCRNAIENTYEPLHYLNDNTSISIAIPSNNAWKTEITASEINSEWDDRDIFSVVNFNNADM